MCDPNRVISLGDVHVKAPEDCRQVIFTVCIFRVFGMKGGRAKRQCFYGGSSADRHVYKQLLCETGQRYVNYCKTVYVSEF